MKTTFDLPDPLLRKAKAAAADQGRPLRDLVAEALAEKLAALALVKGTQKPRNSEWTAFKAKLQKLPDGSYFNPDGIDDPAFFQALEDMRAESGNRQPRNSFADIEPDDKPSASCATGARTAP